jgi:molybdopterin synthase catalytic subunit
VEADAVANEPFADVVEAPIDAAALLARVADPGNGAATLFVGVVRNLHQGQRVVRMTYDCFAPLARKVLAAIAVETAERWPGVRVAVVHRVGRLEVGEASVVIAIGSPHRAASYEASRHVIEEIKARAPIWKQEHYEHGSSEWLDGRDLKAPR